MLLTSSYLFTCACRLHTGSLLVLLSLVLPRPERYQSAADDGAFSQLQQLMPFQGLWSELTDAIKAKLGWAGGALQVHVSGVLTSQSEQPRPPPPQLLQQEMEQGNPPSAEEERPPYQGPLHSGSSQDPAVAQQEGAVSDQESPAAVGGAGAFASQHAQPPVPVLHCPMAESSENMGAAAAENSARGDPAARQPHPKLVLFAIPVCACVLLPEPKQASSAPAQLAPLKLLLFLDSPPEMRAIEAEAEAAEAAAATITDPPSSVDPLAASSAETPSELQDPTSVPLSTSAAPPPPPSPSPTPLPQTPQSITPPRPEASSAQARSKEPGSAPVMVEVRVLITQGSSVVCSTETSVPARLVEKKACGGQPHELHLELPISKITPGFVCITV